MKDSIVRIQKIELINFKNVKNGIIEFKNNTNNSEEYIPSSEILGVYGQNGSGKTALVNACNFFKSLLEGLPFPNDAYNYINIYSNEATVKIELYMNVQKEEYIVNYEFSFKKVDDKKVVICKEKLGCSKKENGLWNSKVTLIDYDIENKEEIFLPKYRYSEILTNNKENIVNLKVAQRLAIDKNASFIFSNEVKSIFLNAKQQKDINIILETLTYFARCNLFVIMNDHTGIISMNVLMPLSFRLEEKEQITSGDILVGLGGVSVVSKPAFEILNLIINQMNVVLKYIVPSLQIELFNYGEQHDENGNQGIKVELLSVKDKAKLPIKYESEGIKKIISILSALIAMYNNPSICMVVDELDSGIYEFLLGEMLKVIEKGGKGQLIFTSHNLRPLEILSKESLYFTTTNTENRYIRFSNVKPNNNLRSLYIRSINLGGQKEELYEETNSIEIQRAFRLAGEKFDAI